MEKLLNELADRMKRAYPASLVSVILYGSAAAGEFDKAYSDLNILCVLTRITPDELAASEPIFRWWREKGNPAPLLLSEEEVANSTDCFPIEFTDMLERRRVVHGKDVIEGLEIDRSFYRAQVEYELRSKLIRLRQKAAGVLNDNDLLVTLMADSESTFLVLARHVLALSGYERPRTRVETVEAAQRHFGVDTAPFETLLAVREGRSKPGSVEARAVFGRYLAGVQTLVSAVDSLEK
ncbi:MAG: nucleotidyltransferase domain-containing protein [Bryobacteraceae bacterium]